jgi:hypothetical protein
MSRDNDIGERQTKPAHEPSPIQQEAVRNSSTGPAGTIHRYHNEITADTLPKEGGNRK